MARFRLPVLLTALLGLGAAPACAATTADASYVVNLGGNIIANAKFHFVDDGSAYSLSLDANVSGVAQLVASGIAKVDSSGAVTADGLRSNSFDTPTGTLAFDEKGDLKDFSFVVYEWHQDGTKSEAK